MKLPKIAISNYQFTIIVFILITITGLNSYLNMPRMENPEIKMPGASVMILYPGTNPVDLEQLVVTPIEDVLNELDDIKRIETTINNGFAIISIEFYFGTDADDKYDDVVEKVNTIRNNLPADIYDISFMQWSVSDVCMMQLALVSDSIEYRILQKKAEKLEKELKKEIGVKKVEIFAYPEQEVRISLDIEQMAQMNISLDHISNAIKSSNANIPGGSIKLDDKSFSIKTSGSYTNLDEIRNTVINSYQGRLIYLKNIATVDFDYEDTRYLARLSGKRALFITVKQKEGRNVFNTTEGVKAKIDEFRENLDDDISLEYVYDQSVGVSEKINNFQSNLLQGIVLVGLIILLALSFRSALIVITAIPLSIITGLAFVDWAGFGLEQMSIAGLVVALGLLVDNSIVMTENISRFLSMGYKPRDAAIKGASEIGWPIVSATATTVLAFIPIILIPEKVGQFMRSNPVAIIATLSVSLFIALTLTPLIASKIFKQKPKSNAIDTKKKNNHRYLRRFIEGPYRRILSFSLSHKVLIITAAITVLFGSLFMVKYVGFSLFPKAEKPQFLIKINLPEGSNLDKTNSMVYQVEAVLDTIEDVNYYASNIGHGNPRIYYNEISKSYIENYGDIFVFLKEYDIERFDNLISQLRKTFNDFPGARIEVKEFEQGTPIAAPIMVYIDGDNMDELRRIALDVEKFIRNETGTVNINNELAKSRTDLFLNINKEKANLFGVPIHEIDKTIRAAITGMPISKFRNQEGEEFNIVMRLPFEERVKMSDFDKIYVKSMSGKLIPLKQLASIEFKKAPSLITRHNLSRTALITADIEKGASLDEIMKPVIQKLKEYPFPNAYAYRISGELESRGEAFGGMKIAMIIALISIFAVLVLQFKSFTQPLIIFTAIPLALIGSIWALFITGNTFSFAALIGLLSLIGIVINNSIILVDYTNRLRNDGKTIIEALKTAGETRFTPIILTTLTTIGGLLPLTLRGGTIWAPMGWVIIGGLSVSTILTLIIVPVLYYVFSSKVKHISQQ
ncbi:MAG: efflux RND transporter permease subunit [Bacteroidota bacterium]|nr:efflux RND transporter permease subunit [Bacteroidota bacterium]